MAELNCPLWQWPDIASTGSATFNTLHYFACKDKIRRRLADSARSAKSPDFSIAFGSSDFFANGTAIALLIM